MAVVALAFSSCAPADDTVPEQKVDIDRPAAADDSVPATVIVARCYRTPKSIFARVTAFDGRVGPGPGWLRIEYSQALDSGIGLLVDNDGGSLGARWKRAPAESVVVVGMDDFLRVELRLSISDSIATGSALATSDADFERDASGRLRDYRREWKLVATHAPCENMPAPAR